MAKVTIGIALLAASFGPALARQTYIDGAASTLPTDYPGAPRPVRDPDSPYAMNYADEAAQASASVTAIWTFFLPNPRKTSHICPLSAVGLGSDGAMLKLQWQGGGCA